MGEDPEGPEALRAELQGFGHRAQAVEADLALTGSTKRMPDEAEARLGVPTVLVNNAAYSTLDAFLELDARTLDVYYAVNLRATVLLSVLFARRLRSATRGPPAAGSST